jgi:RNA polymerase sigma factor (sigma-70 family)
MAADLPRSIARYYAEISQTSLINEQEERRLILLYKRHRDTKARDQLISSHLRFVVAVARKHTKDTDQLQELIAAGNIGLLTALERYDLKRKVRSPMGNGPARPVRFLTYAGWWVQEAIFKEIYSNSLVHVPTHRQKAQRKRAKAYAKALTQFGPDKLKEMDPGLPEASTVDLDKLDDRLRMQGSSHGEDEDDASSFQESHAARLLRQEIAQLPPREQTVLNCYFGIKDCTRNLPQIAALLGMSPERIRQIKIEAVKTLRERMQAHHAVNSASDVY